MVPSASSALPSFTVTVCPPSAYSPSAAPARSSRHDDHRVILTECTESDAQRGRMDMKTIADQLRVQVTAGDRVEGGADHAGRAVGQPVHRVEQVGEMPRAPFHRLHCLLVVGGGVRNGYRAVRLHLTDECLGARLLRGDIHHTDDAAAPVVQPAELRLVRRTDEGRILRTLFARRDIRPSMLMPWIYAPGSLPMQPATLANSRARVSAPSVIEVGQKEVIPLCSRCSGHGVSASGVPSPMSQPAQPWTWMSIKPGITVQPVRSSARRRRLRRPLR